MVVVELAFAVLCAALSKADVTLNNLNPECKTAAFINDDKFISCDFDSSIEADISTCLNSSVSNALSAGASVKWCFNHKGNSRICSNSSFVHQDVDDLPSLNISNTGMLHIDPISDIMKRPDLLNCSFVSSQGEVCEPPVILNLLIFSTGAMRTHFKELDIPSSVIAIGLNLTLCMSGTAKGYSSAHWTVDDGEAIDALDISDTQPSPNISNYVPPACSTCSCHDKYLATRSVQKKMEKNLARFGYVAFVIPYYSLVNGDEYSRIGHLCNLPDSFLTILVIKEVSGRARTMDIKFSLSNEDNRESSTSSMVSVGYYQPDNDVFIHSFGSEQVTVQPGANAAFICNATTAGDSTATFEWRNVAPLLPEMDVDGNDRIAVSSLTKDEVERLCEGISGVYHLPLRSMFGRDPEVESGGATLLLHYSALVICNADSSLTNSYLCFATNTSSPGELINILTESSNETTSGIIAGIVVTILVVLAFGIVMIFVVRNRCLKTSPVPMAHYDHCNISSVNYIFEEDNYHLEFPRDNVHLLDILGEGQFGQVFKATAEGICPDNLHRSVVAVKTLKSNATWSDKDDLQSELNIMLHIEPHRNIINIIGMCSETDTEPLMILMEFAMHGSLKDYLKKLITGKLSFLHPLQAQICSCSCHTHTTMASHPDRTKAPAYQNVGRLADVSAAQTFPLSESGPHSIRATSKSPDACLGFNAETHAARLLCLLDSNFPQYDSNITGIEYPNEVEEDLDSTRRSSIVSNSCECFVGRCAHHSACVDDCPHKYINIRRNVNSCQNHRGSLRSELTLAETPRSNAPLLSYPPNLKEEEEEHVSEDCPCRYLCNSTDQNSRSGPSSTVVALTSCAYCSPCRSKAAAPACQDCVCCEANGKSKGRLSYFQLLDFASQISRGMEHLNKMKYVHRDLAARNILITENFHLKIGDFGLSRDLSGEDYYRKMSLGRVPARWMAIESLMESIHTSNSDVWSYGVVLWEILTYGQLPYGTAAVANSIESLAHHINSGKRLHKPDTCTTQMYEIMKRCWDHTPEQRPSFSQLANAFNAMLERFPVELNRNIEEIPHHPEIGALEADMFSSFLSLHPEQLALPRVAAPTMQEASVSPAYNMPAIMNSGLSSTESGHVMSEQNQSPPNSRGQLETRRVCAPPYPLCEVQRTEQTFPNAMEGTTVSSHPPDSSQLAARQTSSSQGKELEQCYDYPVLVVKSDGTQAAEALPQQTIIRVEDSDSFETNI